MPRPRPRSASVASSCHGPGAEHVAWASEAPSSGAQPPANHGFAVDFSNGESTIQQCAGCHSRREPYLDGNPPPGKPYHDSYNLSLLAPGLYHADGQIQDEVYVYGSFLQSKMYRAGVSCMNCHDPHKAEIKFTGNTLCVQCHNPAGNPAFPSLKPATFDSQSHHFHEQGTPGAQCVNCHMVERVYMGVDGRRDHSFRIPRPDLAAQTGAPDACTDCHTGQGADWAAARIAEWYPNSENRRRHFGVTLALGREDPAAAADALADLALDTSEPGIARATALRLLEGSGQPAAAERAEPLLRDPDPLVRAAAIGVQRLAPPRTGSARGGAARRSRSQRPDGGGAGDARRSRRSPARGHGGRSARRDGRVAGVAVQPAGFPGDAPSVGRIGTDAEKHAGRDDGVPRDRPHGPSTHRCLGYARPNIGGNPWCGRSAESS